MEIVLDMVFLLNLFEAHNLHLFMCLDKKKPLKLSIYSMRKIPPFGGTLHISLNHASLSTEKENVLSDTFK